MAWYPCFRWSSLLDYEILFEAAQLSVQPNENVQYHKHGLGSAFGPKPVCECQRSKCKAFGLSWTLTEDIIGSVQGVDKSRPVEDPGKKVAFSARC